MYLSSGLLLSFYNVYTHATPFPASSFTKSSLKSVRTELLQQLQNLQGAPSVQMQKVPPPFERKKNTDEENEPDGGKKKKPHGSEMYDNVD